MKFSFWIFAQTVLLQSCRHNNSFLSQEWNRWSEINARIAVCYLKTEKVHRPIWPSCVIQFYTYQCSQHDSLCVLALCENPLDVLFIVDTSSWQYTSNFDHIRNFIFSVVDWMNISDTATQVGVLPFTYKVRIACDERRSMHEKIFSGNSKESRFFVIEIHQSFIPAKCLWECCVVEIRFEETCPVATSCFYWLRGQSCLCSADSKWEGQLHVFFRLFCLFITKSVRAFFVLLRYQFTEKQLPTLFHVTFLKIALVFSGISNRYSEAKCC